MNRRMFLARVALSMTVLSNVMACDVLPKRLPTYRYRLTVEVQTPEGIKAGSSVIEVYSSIESSLNIDNPRGLIMSARGEAVAVDLPGGQTLFALLSGIWSNASPERNAQALLRGRYSNSYEETHAKLIGHKDVVELQPPNYPMLVRFRDVHDPRTIERVAPDNLTVFGHGIRLLKVTVQITPAPVTSGIERRFGWWAKYKDRHFDGTSTVVEDMTSKDLRAHITSCSFSTECNRS